MVLLVGSDGDSIRIVNQYYDSWYHVEKLEFADGKVITKEELFNNALIIRGTGEFGDHDSGYGTRNNTLIGSDEADIISAYSGDDTIIGGEGNDTLYGGTGSDTYIFNPGDGADIINESNANSANDRIVFGEGISPEDVTVTRDGNDMVLLVGPDGDSIRIINQYYDSWYQVENFEFADGTVITKNELFDNGLVVNGSGVIKDYDSGYGQETILSSVLMAKILFTATAEMIHLSAVKAMILLSAVQAAIPTSSIPVTELISSTRTTEIPLRTGSYSVRASLPKMLQLQETATTWCFLLVPTATA